MVGMPKAANENALQFINRLSDYLFVVARTCARATNIDEVLWTKE
jgi:cob(I)alamin adenosyltransferase